MRSLIRFGNSSSLYSLFDEIERDMRGFFFNNYWDYPRGVSLSYASSPSFSLKEEDTHYLLSIDIPGVSKDDINIELQDKELSISGKRKLSIDGNKEDSSQSQFKRIVHLPDGADVNKIQAHHENGVLLVAIGKLESSTPKKIQINDNNSGGFFGKFLKLDEKKQ